MANKLRKPKTSRRIVNEEVLVTLAKETFRFDSVFEKMLSQIDEKTRNRYKNSYPWYKKKIMDVITAGKLEIVDLTNQEYDPGMAVTVINFDEFNENDTLIIDKMLEPIIMSKYGLVSLGTVTVRRKEE